MRNASTRPGFIARALQHFGSIEADVEGVMTENRPDYMSRLFRKTCWALYAHHISIWPYTPKGNGTAQWFIIQTLRRKWAHATPYRYYCAADLPR